MAWPGNFIHIDRQIQLTGTYSAGDDRTTWVLPCYDTTLTVAVLHDSAFSASDRGKILTVTNTGTTVYIDGFDYSAGPAVIGRAFTHTLEFTRPYLSSAATRITDIDSHVTIKQVTVAHRNTGGYTLKGVTSGHYDSTETFTRADTEADQETGTTTAPILGTAVDCRVFVENATPRQSNILAAELVVEVSQARRP